jgi:hypothetical protein
VSSAISGDSIETLTGGAEGTVRRSRDRIQTWNRKLHYYLGLYLLLFLWMFSISGLVLNHPKWRFPQFWNERKETTTENPIRVPASTGDAAIAADLMWQLGIAGEVSEVQRGPAGNTFTFQVVKPGQSFRVAADFPAARASITHIQLNTWGVMDALHKFTGVKLGEPREKRDWLWTSIWSLAMDALALGLVILVVSGLYLWYRLAAKRVAGLIALGLGLACCVFFAYGLAAMLV